MNVLVTGAGGFIAPHVADAFRDAGHNVRTTDASPVPCDPGSITADFTDADKAAELTAEIDVVCHLGGVGDGDRARAQPEEAGLASCLGTASVPKGAEDNGAKEVELGDETELGYPKSGRNGEAQVRPHAEKDGEGENNYGRQNGSSPVQQDCCGKGDNAVPQKKRGVDASGHEDHDEVLCAY